MSRIAVFASASPSAPPVLFEAAEHLGRALARGGVEVVCGGVAVGPLGALVTAARAGGGRVTGVVTRPMAAAGDHHADLTDRVDARDLMARTHEMVRRADGVLALPGGSGTLHEVTAAAALLDRTRGGGRVVLWDVGGLFGDLVRYYAGLAAAGLVSPALPFYLLPGRLDAEMVAAAVREGLGAAPQRASWAGTE